MLDTVSKLAMSSSIGRYSSALADVIRVLYGTLGDVHLTASVVAAGLELAHNFGSHRSEFDVLSLADQSHVSQPVASAAIVCCLRSFRANALTVQDIQPQHLHTVLASCLVWHTRRWPCQAPTAIHAELLRDLLAVPPDIAAEEVYDSMQMLVHASQQVFVGQPECLRHSDCRQLAQMTLLGAIIAILKKHTQLQCTCVDSGSYIPSASAQLNSFACKLHVSHAAGSDTCPDLQASWPA